MPNVDIYTQRHKDGVYLEIRQITPLAHIIMPDDMTRKVIENLEKLLKKKFKNAKRSKSTTVVA